MNIPQELLAEKNYTGTRKILINDPKVRELKAELKELQKSINPIIEGLQDTLKKFDEGNARILEKQKAKQAIEQEIEAIHKELAPDKKLYDKEMEKIQPFDEQAQLIKNKLEPLVMKLVEDQLGEFERPLHVTEDDDGVDIYVEVVDELEQFVQTKRTQKAKAQEKKANETK